MILQDYINLTLFFVTKKNSFANLVLQFHILIYKYAKLFSPGKIELSFASFLNIFPSCASELRSYEGVGGGEEKIEKEMSLPEWKFKGVGTARHSYFPLLKVSVIVGEGMDVMCGETVCGVSRMRREKWKK